MKTLPIWAVILTLWLSLPGCQENSTPANRAQLEAVRGKYLLADEPAGVEGVLDIQETYKTPRDVVMVGQIGGVDNPWTSGKAAFIVADPIKLLEAAGGDESHICEDPGCKFCARRQVNKLKEGLAVIEFTDDQGNVLPIDARELFNVATSQIVVVRGRARINDLGCLVVAASGLYVRR